MTNSSQLLKVERLSVGIQSHRGLFLAVDDISFSLKPGETLALLGESGCGKSMTAFALMQLLPPSAKVLVQSNIQYQGMELLDCSETELRKVRGKKIAMIFQEPMTSLNPVMTVGQQIAEVIEQHFHIEPQEKTERVLDLLELVGIPDPIKRINDYPHQLSGGMKQRIMIAMALAAEPDILIADEPTTALDVTIQYQILSLLKELQQKTGMAILFITHDLGVVKLVADRIAVMYAGQIVETGSAKDFFQQPLHPYSKGLLQAIPNPSTKCQSLKTIPGTVPDKHVKHQGCLFADRCAFSWEDCENVAPELLSQPNKSCVRCHLYDPATNKSVPKEQSLKDIPVQVKTHEPVDVLTVDNLKIHFPIRKGLFRRLHGSVKAVDGVSLNLSAGKTIALVGESGCGKTTTGRGILKLVDINDGNIFYDGKDLSTLNASEMHPVRNDIQIIFQDPYSSMNPRHMVFDIIAEGIRAHQTLSNEELETIIDELLEKVGLPTSAKHRYPHQFSGGQRQRLCIARALAVNPKIIVCDEPTSALDVSVQAQILNLLRELQQQDGLAYLFITHDIGVVSFIADEVAVMYLGRIVEYGPVSEILQSPKHPYTKALLSAVPSLDNSGLTTAAKVQGEQPSPINPPSGCHFHPRCPDVMPVCQQRYPDQTQLSENHCVNCFLYGDENAKVVRSKDEGSVVLES